jgi:hypothetical protein
LTPRKELAIDREVLKLDDLTHGKHCGFTAGREGVAWQGLDSFGEGGYRRVSADKDSMNGEGPTYPSLFDKDPIGYFSASSAVSHLSIWQRGYVPSVASIFIPIPSENLNPASAVRHWNEMAETSPGPLRV